MQHRAYLVERLDTAVILVIDNVHFSSVDSPNLIGINLVSKVEDARHARVADKCQIAIFRVHFVQSTIQSLYKIVIVVVNRHSMQIAKTRDSKCLVVDVLYYKAA